jgi:LPXTG-site transpeptidase (sortase) family protein
MPANSHARAATKKSNPAVELIRRKLDELYTEEPNAKQEIGLQRKTAPRQSLPPQSKHQKFMQQLTTSGKSLAQIQTEWHNYYLGLPDSEKHAVWREFYETNATRPSASGYTANARQETAGASLPAPQAADAAVPFDAAMTTEQRPGEQRFKSVASVRKQLLNRIASQDRARLTAKHHLQSLAFGIGSGALVLLIFLFSFFNQVIIAPLIQPSRNQQNTPIILSTSGVAPSPTPQVIIPKINVQIPVIYNETSTNDAAVETSLEDGVLHYPTTVMPGQVGNTAFFGHSSNNIFNSGKYKFAFVLLHTLVPGDVFYLTYNNKVYAYQVYNREVVSPSDISVLNNVAGKQATATLITCDPPGTSINRLVVWGTQISPSPDTDTAPTTTPTTTPGTSVQAPTQLASDGPTLWGRFTSWVEGIF